MANRINPTTYTPTETAAPRIVLNFSGQGQIPRTFDCQTAIDDVSDIIWDYRDWKDPLSKDLIRWGVDLFKLREIPEKELLPAALSEIDKLHKKILVNPLDYVNHSPLTDPVLERHWVWEKSWFEKWPLIDGTGVSPFDNLPMYAVKPHTFATKMISWLGSLPLNINQPLVKDHNTPGNNSAALVAPATALSTPSIDPSNLRLVTYLVKKSATTYASIAIVRDTTDEMKKTSDLAAKLMEQTEKRCAEERQEFQKKMDAHEKKFEERIEHVELNHDSDVKVLNGRVDDGLAKLAVLKKKQEETEQKADSLEVDNKSMRGTIANLQGQINSMRNQNSGGGCTIF